MTDPFSISAGVVGVVSLGLTVSHGFMSFYGPWKSYDEEVQDFTAKLDGLQNILKVLQGFILDEDEELVLASDQYKKLVSTNLASCKEACRRLEDMLKQCTSTGCSPFVKKHDWLRLKRVAYPFKKETLVTLSQTVSGLQDNLIHRHSNAPSILDPSTLGNFCDRQALINGTWKRQRQRLRGGAIDTILRYCSCRRRPFASSSFSISSFALHETHCPLYEAGEHTVGVAAKYTFYNQLMGFSVLLMMTLTRRARSFSISPVIQFHGVVDKHSPAYELVNQTIKPGMGNAFEMLKLTRNSLLELFRLKKAAPTDRLADGSTVLHLLLDMIEAGVPADERTLQGMTAFDSSIKGGWKWFYTAGLIYNSTQIAKELLTQIEMAIIMRSIEALQSCLLPDISRSAMTGFYASNFEMLLIMCSVSIPHRDFLVFFDCACWHRDFDSAILLLDYADSISSGHLQAAARCGNIRVLERVVCELSASRRQLQEVALQQLHVDAIDSLGLPTAGLLDTKASCVIRALEHQDICVEPRLNADLESLYDAVLCGGTTAADLLYTSGFADMNQTDTTLGFTLLAYLRSAATLGQILDLACWMIDRGAELHHRSTSGHPVVFYLAESLGDEVVRLAISCQQKASSYLLESFYAQLHSVILSLQASSASLLLTILSDEAKDNFTCVCSDNGCTARSRFLGQLCSRGWMNSDVCRLTSVVLQQLLSEKFPRQAPKRAFVSSTIRFLTFEALELTHTCHKPWWGETMDAEEVQEIMEEESKSIEQVEALVMEFNGKYDGLNVSMLEFFESYWKTRMAEVLAPTKPDEHVLRQARDIGVIIKESDGEIE
ncbi:hypothetical protein BJX64DRAFT_279473 [Aspergillus heterothallicus]